MNIVAEGQTDEVVLTRLLEFLNIPVDSIYITGGKTQLDSRIYGYNNAANFSNWLVVRDFDRDAGSVPELLQNLLPNPNPGMIFRIAVNAVESWLLADCDGMANFLSIARVRVPIVPDNLDNPKQTLVNFARNSRRRKIREGLVPDPGTTWPVGPGYTELVGDYVQNYWNITEAMTHSPSLESCLRSLENYTRIT